MLHPRNKSSRTHYEVLSVNENATYNEIKKNYKVAILSSHPDKLRGKSVTSFPIRIQQEIFLDVQKAWEVLSDPKSRENYDNILQASRNELEVVDNEIRLEEMMVQVDGDMKELSFPCRCGDFFLISLAELEELGVSVKNNGGHFSLTDGLTTQASVVLPCDSCSLKVRLIIDANYDPSI
ncbi:DPH4 homolog [Dendrobium catenatum]|uniref:DnaJ protein like n=1 Tax=Dendrobium catenatum TaxID=906689 RepID=A0A2I0VSC0_9ASPA|nr:DPH4 homolog [Dendrobium catenatum]PKU66309.1 DnaJ protein like [Dendrobium catenatum]